MEKEQTISEIINSSQPVLIDFYAEWCGPCKMVSPVIEEFKNIMGDKVRVLKVDVDKNQFISTIYNIRSIPTFMLFHSGNLLWQKVGVVSLSELKNVVNKFFPTGDENGTTN